jgi:hypothetical protein
MSFEEDAIVPDLVSAGGRQMAAIKRRRIDGSVIGALALLDNALNTIPGMLNEG